jgi:hypothetical protein
MEINYDNFTIKKAVENNEIPRFIYKYYTNKKNRLQDTLNNHTIWFSKPMDFNDPFDCRLIVDTNNTNKEILDYIKYLCNKISTCEDDKLKIQLNYLNPKYRYEITNDSIQDVISKSGVSCFSKINNSILMWSHYSNSHKGYCLKFDLLKDPDFFMMPVIVEYKEKYPYFNFIRDNKNLFKFDFGNKFCDWSYEEEIRIVRQEQNNVEINPESIVEISFGINCKNNNVELIKNICKSNNYKHIAFQKAKRKKLDFQMEFEKI